MKTLRLFFAAALVLLVTQLSANTLVWKGDDTTTIQFNKAKILVITNDSTTSDTLISDGPYKGDDDDYENSHWSGVEIGFNGLLTPGNSLNLGNNNSYLDLNYSRSINWSINPIEKGFRLRGEYIKFVTGLGLQFYNFEFDKNYRLTPSQDSISPVLDTVYQFDKNRLKSTFINVPLLFAFNTKQRSDEGLKIAVGAIVGYKIGSRTKQIYQQQGDRTKDVVRSNFNMNPFQVMGTFRVGFKGLSLFANYNITPLFLDGEGPQVHPFSVGISLL